ncbi:CvpA family protein [Aerococcus christensenii]|uniref:CvpA family protein n=1 Tax=Aerococcus christensenii TaxID=87541 RepID=A0A109RE11_9LACT|nr:CvpA family protein [Aerococcus christensenii]AMB92845.1 hypothetical protein AWM71_05940 [Aerococcus christensenii]KXB34574.1 hypothetical protein HMPREF3187_01342 [Aerococcus christensenii]MDK8234071.1 CvpA family protein [Aerococcus christensenii]
MTAIVWGSGLVVVLVVWTQIYRYRCQGFWSQMGQMGALVGGFYLAEHYYLWLADKLALLLPYPQFSSNSFYAYYPQAVVAHKEEIFFRALAFSGLCLAVLCLKNWIWQKTGMNHRGKGGKFWLTGSLVGLVSAWFLLFLIFGVASLVNWPFIQRLLAENPVADFFIRQTPFLTERVYRMWFEGIAVVNL